MKHQTGHRTGVARPRTAGALAVAIVAASGLAAIAGTGVARAADTSSLTLDYRCMYPLIGAKDIRAEISADIPAEFPAGEEIPLFPIRAKTLIGADTTEGLYTMNAGTIEGSALAMANVSTPDGWDFPIDTTVTLEKTTVPESGPFHVNAAGESPVTFGSMAEGWGRVNVGNLTLTVTPKDRDGRPTALGTFNVSCYQKPGQNNVLQQIYFSGASPKPPMPEPQSTAPPQGQEPKSKDYSDHVHSVTLGYTCRYPLIGVHPIKVQARMEYPATVPVGYGTPRITIKSLNVTDVETTEGLLVLDPPAATVDGEAVAWATMTAPEVPAGPLTVRVKMPIPKTAVPPKPARPLEIAADGSAPALVFAEAGRVDMNVGNIDLTMTPRTASGELTAMGVIRTTCEQDPGQENRLARIDIVDTPDTTAPTAPGAPSVTGTGETSVALKWGAATDDVGIAGYDVYNGSAKVASTYGTATATTVQGLRPGTDHTFTVRARDGSGNASPASAPVSARTKTAPDREAPAAPGAPAVTGKTVTTIGLSWRAASDDVGVTAYEVYRNGAPAMQVTGTTARFAGLSPGTSHTFRVRARDLAGNWSALGAPLTVATNKDTSPPTVPGNLRVTGRTPRSVSLAWGASKDNVRVAGYNVIRNGRLVLRVTGTTAVAADLAPNTSYTFKVRARDTSGNLSALTPGVTVRTRPPSTARTGVVADNPFDLFLDLTAPGYGGAAGLTLTPER